MNDSQSSGDPVSLGYVTLEEAKVLFNLYMKHFNIVMPFLDPPKYTHGSFFSFSSPRPTVTQSRKASRNGEAFQKSKELIIPQILYATTRLSCTRSFVSITTNSSTQPALLRRTRTRSLPAVVGEP
jgi:hypothetical protein